MSKSKDEKEKLAQENYHNIIGLGRFSVRKSYFPELQKKIEELRVEKDKYQRIFKEAPHGIIQVNLSGEVLEANPAMIDLCGDGSLTELKKRIGDYRKDLFESSDEVIKFVADIQKLGSIKNYETTFLTQTGKVINVSINALFQKSPDISFIELFVQDISERKQNETKLEEYREGLEKKVKERTAELERQNLELEKFNKLFIGREFRIKELRDKLKKYEE